MDPITQSLALANTALTLAMKIYDDTPQAMRSANAEQWGKFVHNVGGFILAMQAKINSVVVPK
jgi:hypothetical protein